MTEFGPNRTEFVPRMTQLHARAAFPPPSFHVPAHSQPHAWPSGPPFMSAQIGPTRNTRGRTSALRHLSRAVEDTFGTTRTHCDHPSRVGGGGRASVKT